MTRAEDLAERQQLYEQYNPRTGDWVSDGKLILLRFLRDLFYQTPREQSGESGRRGPSFHWEADDSVTELIVSDRKSLDTNSLGSRPAIIVSRGSFQYGNVSIDHLLTRDHATGHRSHTDLVSGSFNIHCVAEQGRTAEILAAYVAKSLRVFRRELQRAGFHLIGTQISVGEETGAGDLFGADAGSKYSMVTVSFPVYYQDAWTVDPVARQLQHLTVRVLAVATRFRGGLIDPDSVDEEGRPVEGSDAVLVAQWTVPTDPP